MHRRRLVVSAAVVVISLGVGTPPAGGVATTPSSTAWSGYATASTFHVNVVQTAAAGPLVENTSVAFSGASVNSSGQSAPITNELGLGVQAVKADREAYGRGSGLEVGAGKSLPNNPDTNSPILPALVQAGALPLEPAAGAPNPYQTELVTQDVTKQSAHPAAYAAVLRGQALATWNDRYTMPMLGHPLGFGLGFADDVQLLNSGAAPAAGEPLTAPVLATDTTAAGGERTTSQSVSLTYLVNNGDGTCGLASETRQTIAPLRLNIPPDANAANDVTIEVLGEWVFRAVATGKPGGSKVEYAPAGSPTPTTPVVRIIQNNAVTNQLTTQQLFGAAGLVLPGALAPVISLAVGEDPRAIAAPTANPDAESKPTITDTEASGAVDVLRLRLLQPNAPAAGVNALDLRLGHMEAKAVVPAGGINCEIPAVKTVSPDPAKGGDDVTFTIFIPTDASALIPFPCELSAIRVVDTVSVESGAPRFTVVGGTGPTGQAGTVEGNTITFPDIGGYKAGDPPLQVKVVVRLAFDSPAGRLKDEVNLTATPINCLSRADVVGRVLAGGAFFGATGARLTGGALTGGGSATDTLRGTANLSGPEISRPAELPKTGPSTTALAGTGGLGIATALLVRRAGRRASTSRPSLT